jgi:hypothetical protein
MMERNGVMCVPGEMEGRGSTAELNCW